MSQDQEGVEVPLLGLSSCYLCGKLVLAVRQEMHDKRAAKLYSVGKPTQVLDWVDEEPVIAERPALMPHSCTHRQWRRSLRKSREARSLSHRMKTALNFTILSAEEQEEMARPYDVECPECQEEAGVRCRHKGKQDGSRTMWAHRGRLFKGLRHQGYEVVQKRGRGGQSQLLVLPSKQKEKSEQT